MIAFSGRFDDISVGDSSCGITAYYRPNILSIDFSDRKNASGTSLCKTSDKVYPFSILG